MGFKAKNLTKLQPKRAFFRQIINPQQALMGVPLRVGLFAAMFFCRRRNTKKTFPLLSLTQKADADAHKLPETKKASF
jgi:hypothetical protein